MLGYEIATRAGIALHSSVSDYHCSGAWNALACAALGGRLFGFDDTKMLHALGIAEYFGPRGQILRVCDHPTMLKDGSGWGAHAGVTAVMLAREGFTGAPALTIGAVATHGTWSDLGRRWRISEQYLKAYPICRWAQPAVEATLALQREHRFASEEVDAVTIESFREAIDLGSKCRFPATTDEAQYSLPYPVAATLVFGRVGAAEVDAPVLGDRRIARLLGAMTLVEDSEFSRRFPAERWARVRITLEDGRVLTSEPARARGDPENPLTDAEVRGKYHELAEAVLRSARAARIEALVDALIGERSAMPALVEELLTPIR